MDSLVNRRDLFKAFSAAAVFTTLQLRAGEPNAPVFFSKEEFALLDTLTELIIPTDQHSPGAHEAGVAAYIDWSTARQIDPDAKTSWTKGLALVNALSVEMHFAPFLKAHGQQRTDVLNRLAGVNGHPSADQNRFWGQLRETTTFLYYSSSIGIHKEMQYQGNVILEQFVGFDAT